MPPLHPGVAFALVLLALLLWVALPFIPALRELFRPRDATPLDAVGQDAGALTFFAERFRRYLRDQALAERIEWEEGDGGAPATLRDGTPLRVLRGAAPSITLPSQDGEPAPVPELVVVDTPLVLPDDMAFEREVYARRALSGGARGVYRALLADEDATLGAESAVLRWAHAERRLVVGDRSVLTGRATAGEELRLGRGVRFERMLAGRIVVGGDDAEVAVPVLVDAPHTTPWIPQGATRMASDTMRIEGDAAMPMGSYASGHLVITGTLFVGADSRIDGSVKAHGDVVVQSRCVVTGAIAARGDVTIGAASRVGGPVIAERAVHVEEDAWLGQPARPTTITAPTISLADGVTVYGAVQAREAGWTE